MNLGKGKLDPGNAKYKIYTFDKKNKKIKN